MVLEMEAPEYLDLDEIDFSDDLVVSVKTLFVKDVLRLLRLFLTLFSHPEVFCDIPEKHPRVVQEERWPG